MSVDLGNSCTNDGECTSGNGGSGSKCGTSTNCECDASRNYVASGSTCVLGKYTCNCISGRSQDSLMFKNIEGRLQKSKVPLQLCPFSIKDTIWSHREHILSFKRCPLFNSKQ